MKTLIDFIKSGIFGYTRVTYEELPEYYSEVWVWRSGQLLPVRAWLSTDSFGNGYYWNIMEGTDCYVYRVTDRDYWKE